MWMSVDILMLSSYRLLWKINALPPPEFKGEDEKVWVNENRAVPPEEMEAARKRLTANL